MIQFKKILPEVIILMKIRVSLLLVESYDFLDICLGFFLSPVLGSVFQERDLSPTLMVYMFTASLDVIKN